MQVRTITFATKKPVRPRCLVKLTAVGERHHGTIEGDGAIAIVSRTSGAWQCGFALKRLHSHENQATRIRGQGNQRGAYGY